ncbi:MAG TPA: 2-amino-4-hydroxy-6-hydroxymethyldihydropteridine diphosphokinase [Terracidiphilus sp.]|nr:2-amino-4-hydroxy-6-hydroxymethyldihydropteridine diphosphokinase [Terracidiphilus sp.]
MSMRTAYIGMGSNLAGPAGSPESALAAALEHLASLGRIAALSSLYSTAPVGFVDQPHFVNTVVALETALAPRALLGRLLAIEKYLGRDRASAIVNGPRTLDLDILLIGDLCVGQEGLHLPHPRLAERAFVLVPLAEIAPNLVEPRSRRTITGLLNDLLRQSPAAASAVTLKPGGAWPRSR